MPYGYYLIKIPAPKNVNACKKESVELTFVYQVGGCGKTLTTINDAIPHTWIV